MDPSCACASLVFYSFANKMLCTQSCSLCLLDSDATPDTSPNVLARIWQLSGEVGLFRSSIFLRYIALSVLNGAAFTSYSLASTFVLTRISVVHHAALNCMRRVFAIVMTSFIFAINVTRLSWFGILISVGGFSAFTHYKLKRLKEPRPLSSLLPMSAV